MKINFDITVEHTSVTEVRIIWVKKPKDAEGYWEIVVKDILGKVVYTLKANDDYTGCFNVGKLMKGQIYTIEVLLGEDKVVDKKVDFEACFSLLELSQLMERATNHLKGDDRGEYREAVVFYRNKPKEYWDKISAEGRAQGDEIFVEKAYLKDYNGDSGNPINRKIKGLFFNAKTEPDGSLPKVSPFGNVRFHIEAQYMLTTKHHLYFSDYYCTGAWSPHYVTIVVTYPGSEQDKFCAEHLLPLDLKANDFIYISSDDKVMVHNSKGLIVEVFYAGNVNLFLGRFKPCEIRGRGSSSYWGLAKLAACKRCNLYDDEGCPIKPEEENKFEDASTNVILKIKKAKAFLKKKPYARPQVESRRVPLMNPSSSSVGSDLIPQLAELNNLASSIQVNNNNKTTSSRVEAVQKKMVPPPHVKTRSMPLYTSFEAPAQVAPSPPRPIPRWVGPQRSDTFSGYAANYNAYGRYRPHHNSYTNYDSANSSYGNYGFDGYEQRSLPYSSYVPSSRSFSTAQPSRQVPLFGQGDGFGFDTNNSRFYSYPSSPPPGDHRTSIYDEPRNYQFSPQNGLYGPTRPNFGRGRGRSGYKYGGPSRYQPY